MQHYKFIRRRRLKSLTNYHKRILLLKGGKDRIVVRKSNRGIVMQIVKYEPKGDKIMASAYSSELKSMGWSPRSNLPTAYLTGMLLAKKARTTKTKECIADIGLYKPYKSSVVFAAIKGSADNGLKLLNNIEVDEKRISGSHIKDYATKAPKNKEQFASYKKENFDPLKITELFNEVKKKLKE